uniref:Uncharacterized protein n=1 Tax=Arundo donax TaxID=35708 RepID=A0A0A9BWC9_ARUDO
MCRLCWIRSAYLAPIQLNWISVTMLVWDLFGIGSWGQVILLQACKLRAIIIPRISSQRPHLMLLV